MRPRQTGNRMGQRQIDVRKGELLAAAVMLIPCQPRFAFLVRLELHQLSRWLKSEETHLDSRGNKSYFTLKRPLELPPCIISMLPSLYRQQRENPKDKYSLTQRRLLGLTASQDAVNTPVGGGTWQ